MVFNALTFARSLGRCWKPRPSASVFNTFHGTWRMLMHKKPCLIPIWENIFVELLLASDCSCICTTLLSRIIHAHLVLLSVTKRHCVHFMLNPLEIDYEIDVLIVWKFSQPECDTNPWPSACKSIALTSRPLLDSLFIGATLKGKNLLPLEVNSFL